MTIRLAKILVAVDFSEESKKALRYAVAFGSCFAASVTVLHFVEPIACQADYGYGPVTQHLPDLQALQQARKRLNALGKRLAALGVNFNVLVRTGVAHHEIARAARELDSDLVIMGTCGARPEGAPATASTAECVVRHAPCPVLIVRRKEHEFVGGERGSI